MKPGCMMCHSLYVKANGEIPCWDDVGEDRVLWRMHPSAHGFSREPVFHHPELIRIRQSFQDGVDPFPDICHKCAVRGCGAVTDLKPSLMQVLHLEASYLCHLSCPQCVPASARKTLKNSPYHLTSDLLENLLRQLKDEGISEILFIHFEGRGDPLANPDLPNLVRISKLNYPRAIVGATTHGSYAYRDQLVRCGMDNLRVSVDGAYPDSYAKYRVGGDFNKVMKFLCSLRDGRRHAQSNMQVEWKYILFEWNDSDKEIRHAAELAADFDARLRFVITHTPGRSQRFTSVAALRERLFAIAPEAGVEVTFQLRSPEERAADARSVVGEYVTGLLVDALKLVRGHMPTPAIRKLREVLRYDPGIDCTCTHASPEDLLETHLEEVIHGAHSPATLSWFAAICREAGRLGWSDRLMWRYLELAPNAPDYDHVLGVLQPKRSLAADWRRKIKALFRF